jgi:ABC-2 type transport system permease protein
VSVRIVAAATARALFARRRVLFLLLLAAVPILIGLLARWRGLPGEGVERTANAIEQLVVRAVLPLVALVLGTAAIGAEIEDGTVVHLLTKPVARWRILTGKLIATTPPVVVLVAGTTLVAGLIIGGDRGAATTVLALTVGVTAGAVAYTFLFVTLGVVTGRALIAGLAYVIVWEGVLAGLFEGSRSLSIREYTLSVAAALDPSGPIATDLRIDPVIAVVGLTAVIVISFAVGVARLARLELQAGD